MGQLGSRGLKMKIFLVLAVFVLAENFGLMEAAPGYGSWDEYPTKAGEPDWDDYPTKAGPWDAYPTKAGEWPGNYYPPEAPGYHPPTNTAPEWPTYNYPTKADPWDEYPTKAGPWDDYYPTNAGTSGLPPYTGSSGLPPLNGAQMVGTGLPVVIPNTITLDNYPNKSGGRMTIK